MAIVKVTAAEYKKVRRDRKSLGNSAKTGKGLYFKGRNGKYYKSTLPGMDGVEEMAQAQKAIKQDCAAEQLTLL